MERTLRLIDQQVQAAGLDVNPPCGERGEPR
jgi:hypothetical protein